MTAPMLPGRYLQLRRVAAGIAIEDVAAGFQTTPRVDELARAELLRQAEAEQDVGNMTVEIAGAYLAAGVSFDPTILIALASRSAAHAQVCSMCGCSWDDPCEDPTTGAGCRWAAAGLCTSCAPPAATDALERAA